MTPSSGPVAAVLLLAGAGLYFAPDTAANRVRTAVLDALRPGQLAAGRCADMVRGAAERMSSQSERSRDREIEQLQERLRQEQSRTAALQVQLARQADGWLREQSLPAPIRSLPRLTTTALIDAVVLGDLLAEQWRRGKLLDRGEAHGVRESELVLKSGHSLVDIGRDAGLSAEDALLLGRCVIGKIERVGRWTSSFLLLTDAGYRGRAQLVHQTDSGFVFGAKGILEGRGDARCRLTGVASSESVTVGDAVYTVSREASQRTPLYYGRVVEATLGPSESHWQIVVEPVPVPGDLTTVQVLRTAVNLDRL